MKEPSLLFQVITLPLIGYLFISVLLFTSVVEFPIDSPSTFVPTNTPAVLVVTATPESPLTPMTAVAFTHTPVPSKTPPTATLEPISTHGPKVSGAAASSKPIVVPLSSPTPDAVLKMVQRFEQNLQGFPSHVNISWECEHKKAKTIGYISKSFCQGKYSSKNNVMVGVTIMYVDISHEIRIVTMLAEGAPND